MGNSASKSEASAAPLARSSTSASNKEVPASPYPRASLLGLPTELRLMMYDIIKDSDIHHYLPHKYESRHSPQPPPRLPLRDLARSCKLLAREIRDHRQSLPAEERHATIIILVRSDDHDHDYYLSHAACPAKDLSILKLDYTVLLADYYWTDFFPEFREFKWRLLEPSIPDGLPDALDLQVSLHFRQDENSPPEEENYIKEAENTCELIEHSHQARYILPKVQRLMGFTIEPWKPLPPGVLDFGGCHWEQAEWREARAERNRSWGM